MVSVLTELIRNPPLLVGPTGSGRSSEQPEIWQLDATSDVVKFDRYAPSNFELTFVASNDVAQHVETFI
jgi:hypothetical protein